MASDDSVTTFVDRWLAEADAGRLLTATELCADDPVWTSAVEERIAVLRQFHALSRPSPSTLGPVDAFAETAAESVPTGPRPEAGIPRPGDLFGKFRIVRELGRGGMGIVFHARDTT